jgi:hypothetical protein
MLYRGMMTKGEFKKRVSGVSYKGLPNKKRSK